MPSFLLFAWEADRRSTVECASHPPLSEALLELRIALTGMCSPQMLICMHDHSLWVVVLLLEAFLLKSGLPNPTMPSPLKPPNRLITTHNAEGKAIFSNAFAEETEQKQIGGDAAFMLGYTTDEFPADLNDDQDIRSYRDYSKQPPGLVINTGSVLRYVDVPPGSTSPMHRTVSLDYGIVLEGEIELVLDSGETRRMGVGDVAIQRGTMHAWRNVGSSWARMVYILQPCKAVKTADGKMLKEDYADMQGVRAST